MCLVPDGDYTDPVFRGDLVFAAARLSAELGVRVEVRNSSTSYYPTKDSWSDEYRDDLRSTMGFLFAASNITVIGVTDDALAQTARVPRHIDNAWPAERLAVVSGFGAGTPGKQLHHDRLHRLLLRAVAQVHYGIPLDDDPTSLMFRGITTPADLDGKRPPTLK